MKDFVTDPMLNNVVVSTSMLFVMSALPKPRDQVSFPGKKTKKQIRVLYGHGELGLVNSCYDFDEYIHNHHGLDTCIIIVYI